jgi:hypothetical protein
LVKVDAQGEAQGEPELLSPSRPLPSGLAVGRVPEDGTTYALHPTAGILVRSHGSKANTRLLHVPAGTTGKLGTIHDISLSPDGSTLAAVVDDRVIVLRAGRSGS